MKLAVTSTEDRLPKAAHRPIEHVLTPEIALEIVNLRSKGLSLNQIAKQLKGKMSIFVVHKWLMTDSEFNNDYWEATKCWVSSEVDNLIEIADNTLEDPQRSSIKIKARQWLASKILRSTFGDHMEVKTDSKVTITVSDNWSKPVESEIDVPEVRQVEGEVLENSSEPQKLLREGKPEPFNNSP